MHSGKEGGGGQTRTGKELASAPGRSAASRPAICPSSCCSAGPRSWRRLGRTGLRFAAVMSSRRRHSVSSIGRADILATVNYESMRAGQKEERQWGSGAHRIEVWSEAAVAQPLHVPADADHDHARAHRHRLPQVPPRGGTAATIAAGSAPTQQRRPRCDRRRRRSAGGAALGAAAERGSAAVRPRQRLRLLRLAQERATARAWLSCSTRTPLFTATPNTSAQRPRDAFGSRAKWMRLTVART